MFLPPSLFQCFGQPFSSESWKIKSLQNFNLGVFSIWPLLLCALCFSYHITLLLFQLMFAICYSYLLSLLGLWVLFLWVERITFGRKILVQSACSFHSPFPFFWHNFVWFENWFLALCMRPPCFLSCTLTFTQIWNCILAITQAIPCDFLPVSVSCFCFVKGNLSWCVYKHLSFCNLWKCPFPFL